MSHNQIHLFEGYTLDLGRGCLLRDGEEVHLRPQSYEVLKYLADNNGRLVSKDRLIEDVWQGRAVTDGSLGKCIEEVREALGENARQYVRNVRGRGYIFDPEAGGRQKLESTSVWTEQVDVLRMVFKDEEETDRLDETEQPAPQHVDLRTHVASPTATPETDAPLAVSGVESTSGEVRRYRRMALLMASALVIAVAAVFAYFKYPGSRSPAITSIAVLPFANAGGDQETEYISDGFSESLINTLSQLPGLKVIARNSSFRYKGKDVDPQAVARELSVQALLMGRVVQRDNNLIVSVELVDARDRTQVWGAHYTRGTADIQAVQAEITRTISEKLRLRSSGAPEQQLAKRATENSQAYQFYSNGLFYLRKGGAKDVRKALDYFNQAVALDPNFAPGWAGVARANRYFSGNSLLDPKEPLARAKAAARKALELDETLSEAHVELGGIKLDEWDWVGAEREYRRAIELNPSLVEAHTRYSTYLSVMGQHAEAIVEIKRAQELDPLEVGLRFRESEALMLARRYDEAIHLHQSVSQPNTAHLYLGFLYEAKGMYGQAIKEYRRAPPQEMETSYTQIALGHALAMSGKTDEARVILDELKSKKEYVSPAELAILHIGLGDTEGAFASLERAYAAHDLQLQYLKVDPRYDSLRSEPRFQDLVRLVGLTP